MNIIKNERYQQYFAWGIFLGVFYFSIVEPQLLGFIPGHHGWVSSEQLAMIGRSTLENGFVGYRFMIDGNPSYFPKMSFIFMAIFNGLISIPDNISSSLSIARYIMDIVLFLNFVLLFNLLRLITNNWRASFLGIIFGGCGTLLVYYSDLVSPDIFLTLSFLISAHAIYFLKEKKYRLALVLAFISINLGFVLINVLPFFLWGIILTGYILTKKIDFNFYIKNIVIIFLAGVLTVALFIYNIHQEAEIRNVSIQQTDVFHSFEKRAGGYSQDYYNKYLKGKVETENYMPMSINIFIEKFVTPAYKYILKFNTLNIVFLILLFLLIISRNDKVKLHNIDILAITLIASIYTFFVLKGYVIIHDFGKLPLMIFSVILWVFIFIKIDKKYFFPLFLAGLYIFYNSYTLSYEDKNNKLVKQKMDITDFDNINEVLRNKKVNVYVENGYRYVYRGAPYVLGFLMKEQNIVSSFENADFVLSKFKCENTLTPKNSSIYLCENYMTKKWNYKINQLKNYQKVLSAKFDIYKHGDKLILYKEKCTNEDTKDRFFVHIYPIDEMDLPTKRQKYKFDNLDFKANGEIFFNGKCYIEKELPKYKYKSIGIGQYNKNGRSWSETIGEK